MPACIWGAEAYAETESALQRLAPPADDLAEFRRQAALSQIASYRGDRTFAALARGALAHLDGAGREPTSAADLHLAGRVAWSLGDYERAQALGSAAADRARETALGVLPEALRLVAVSTWITGHWNVAYAVDRGSRGGGRAWQVAHPLRGACGAGVDRRGPRPGGCLCSSRRRRGQARGRARDGRVRPARRPRAGARCARCGAARRSGGRAGADPHRARGVRQP